MFARTSTSSSAIRRSNLGLEQQSVPAEILYPCRDAFVADDVLTSAIWKLRQAFDDDSKNPHFIQTVPRRGYQLIASVTFEQGKDKRWISNRSAIILGSLIVVALMVLIIGFNAFVLKEDGLAAGEITSIAVLPLANQMNDPALGHVPGRPILSASTQANVNVIEVGVQILVQQTDVLDHLLSKHQRRAGDPARDVRFVSFRRRDGPTREQTRE